MEDAIAEEMPERALPLSAQPWAEAEAQIQRHAQSKPESGSKSKSESDGVAVEYIPTVSVKSTAVDGKRKGETAEQVYKEEIGNREAKRLKKGMRKRGGGSF